MSRSSTSSGVPRPSTLDQQAALVEQLDGGHGVALVGLEALADGLGRVVGALHDLAAAVVADPRRRRRLGDGVDGAAVLADPRLESRSSTTSRGTSRLTARSIGGDAEQGLGLADRAGEAVEQEAVRRDVVAGRSARRRRRA